jgi:hypothetical protein
MNSFSVIKSCHILPPSSLVKRISFEMDARALEICSVYQRRASYKSVEELPLNEASCRVPSALLELQIKIIIFLQTVSFVNKISLQLYLLKEIVLSNRTVPKMSCTCT